jgi:diadenosine tetraphosphate (Ap4A) HIT family hydrolase
MTFWTYTDLQKRLGGKERFGEDDCPFCRDIKESRRIIWKWKFWCIILNDFPYIHTGEHIMLIPIRHIQYNHELLSEESSELPIAYRYIKNFYKQNQYFSFTRESMANRSVEHVHTHFLPWRIKRDTIVKMMHDQGFDIYE